MTWLERIQFDHPALYRTKRFLVERVLWDWILGRIFGLEQRPMPESLSGLEGCRVLLAGCGPGDATTGPRIDGAQRVTAFDLSRHFASACARNHPDWQVFCGDLLHIPHRDGEFEAAVLYSTLHHVPVYATEILSELARVAGGRVVLVEGVVPERGWLRRLLLLWYRIVDGGHHYYTLRELRNAIETLGLQIESESFHGPIAHMWLVQLAPDSVESTR